MINIPKGTKLAGRHKTTVQNKIKNTRRLVGLISDHPAVALAKTDGGDEGI